MAASSHRRPSGIRKRCRVWIPQVAELRRRVLHRYIIDQAQVTALKVGTMVGRKGPFPGAPNLRIPTSPQKENLSESVLGALAERMRPPVEGYWAARASAILGPFVLFQRRTRCCSSDYCCFVFIIIRSKPIFCYKVTRPSCSDLAPWSYSSAPLMLPRRGAAVPQDQPSGAPDALETSQTSLWRPAGHHGNEQTPARRMPPLAVQSDLGFGSVSSDVHFLPGLCRQRLLQEIF